MSHFGSLIVFKINTTVYRKGNRSINSLLKDTAKTNMMDNITKYNRIRIQFHRSNIVHMFVKSGTY